MRFSIIYISLFCFLLPLSSLGQDGQPTKSEEKKSSFSHQIGINGTTLLKQFISSGDTSIVQSPYILTYKLVMGSFAFRAGAGGTYLTERIQEEGFADTETRQEYTIELRGGVEYQTNMNRWQGSFGVDLIGYIQDDRFISDTGFDKVTIGNQIRTWGVGPAIGLRFLVNEHLSIYTEGAIYYTMGDRISSRLFTNFPQFDDKVDEAAINETRLFLPASLYIVYEF